MPDRYITTSGRVPAETTLAADGAPRHLDRRYDEMQHFSRFATDDTWLPFALERLAQLHEDRGHRTEAARYYARFAELWAEADPELQPRVDAATRALARLTGEAGG